MEIVDYARPTMMAERALRELHEAMLRRDYEAALERCNAVREITEEIKVAIEHEAKSQMVFEAT